MTKKLTWEVEKTSLVLKVTDGAKETTWRLRKNMPTIQATRMLDQMRLELSDEGIYKTYVQPYEASVEAFQQSSGISTDALTEEGSMEALNARVGELKRNARWMDATEDDIYTVEISDYDSGEV